MVAANTSIKVSKDLLVYYIDNKYSMTAMARTIGCSKNKIKSLLKHNELEEYYAEVVGNTASKMPRFKINNIELKQNLEKYGPLYNVID